MPARLKMTAPDDSSGLLDRLEQLVQNLRTWAGIELKLLQARAQFAAKAYILAFISLVIALIASGTGVIFLAMGVVVALTPYLGLAGAYCVTALGFVLLSAIFVFYAYRTITNATVSALDKGRRV
jgi:hypothetical protein